MPLTLKSLPIYALSSIVFLGAFSRFTHGIYTPQWYAFQEYHSPDDGSTAAVLTPFIDTLVGVALVFGGRKARRSAAVTSLLFFVLGLVMQVTAGKEFWGDVSLVVVAGAAVLVGW
ncbi:hypothetical protein BJX70DRAFT_369421 [Aspergillus crustosus]